MFLLVLAFLSVALCGPLPNATCVIRQFPENFIYSQPTNGLNCPATTELCQMGVSLYGNSLKSVFINLRTEVGSIIAPANNDLSTRTSCGTFVSGGYAEAIVSFGSFLTDQGGQVLYTFRTNFTGAGQDPSVLVCPNDPRVSTFIDPTCDGFYQVIFQLAIVSGSRVILEAKNSMTDQTTCPFPPFCCGTGCPNNGTVPFATTTFGADTTLSTTTTTTEPTTTTTTTTTEPTTTTTTTTTEPTTTTTTTTTVPTTTTTTTTTEPTTTTTTVPTTTTSTTTSTTTTAPPTTTPCIGQNDLYGVCDPDLEKPCCLEGTRCARHAKSPLCNTTVVSTWLCIPIVEV